MISIRKIKEDEARSIMLIKASFLRVLLIESVDGRPDPASLLEVFRGMADFERMLEDAMQRADRRAAIERPPRSETADSTQQALDLVKAKLDKFVFSMRADPYDQFLSNWPLLSSTQTAVLGDALWAWHESEFDKFDIETIQSLNQILDSIADREDGYH